MQAIAGTAAPYADAAKPRGRHHELEALLERHLKEVRADAERGGIPEAILRILLACMQAGGGADVHAARLAEQARHRHDELKKLSHQQIKEIVRKQALLVRFNPELAMETLPKLLPTSTDRDQVIEFVRELVGKLDAVRPEIADVLQRIRDVLKQPPGVPQPPRPSAAEAQRVEAERSRRAS